MIPWVEWQGLELADGGVLKWFTLLYVVGAILGIVAAHAHLRKWQMPDQGFRWLVVASLVVGVLVGHWVAVFWYRPEAFFGTICAPADGCIQNGMFLSPCPESGHCNDGRWGLLFEPFNGSLTAGAELGMVLVFLIWAAFVARRYTVEERLKLGYALLLVPLGAFWLSAIGCYGANDHLTRPLDWLIATPYPDGLLEGVPGNDDVGPVGITPRVNLGGMHFAILTLILTIPVARFFARRKWSLEFTLAIMLFLYAKARTWSAVFYATDISDPEPRVLAFGDFDGFHIDLFISVLNLLLSLWLLARVWRNQTIWESPTP
jgi:hypothetical protein